MSELFSQCTKQQEACASLLDAADILLSGMGHQLYCCLSSFEQLTEPIDIMLILNIELMFAIGCNVNLQLVMDLLRLIKLSCYY
jgi:hypothetical protein